jgi:predicted nucleotidyltransferase component of viral defense system
MLTRSQIQRAAQRNGIGVQAQERDYIQHLLLWLTYAQGQALIFGGGAALRIVYGGSRYSDDLAFAASPAAESPEALQGLWQRTVRRLGDFGIAASIRSERQTVSSVTYEIGYRGPLFDGSARSESRLRVAVGLEREPVEVGRELVTCGYDDVRPFVVTALTPEQLMADAIRAVVLWAKPEDLYDLWVMQAMGVQPEHRLIERALARHGVQWQLRMLVESLDAVQFGWERSLRHLLPQYVPFQTVKQGMVRWLVGF